METLLALILKDVVPCAIEMVKSRHTHVNPNLPPLTDEEAVALLNQAVASSVAKDDQWLAAHR